MSGARGWFRGWTTLVHDAARDFIGA
jgi:hypothetical protein